MQKKILIIEDERRIQDILIQPLQSEGYQVYSAFDGLEGIQMFEKEEIDLILLDLMLPKLNGYEVCKRIRQDSNVPIIMLTALESEDDQVKGFNLSADDYITKPFSIRIVLKRVEALIRRTATKPVSEAIHYKDIEILNQERRVYIRGIEIPLTHIEYDLLLLFINRPGRVFTRDDILNLVWGYDYIGEEKGVNFHIMNLRKKLNVDYIETVRGVGYRIAKEN